MNNTFNMPKPDSITTDSDVVTIQLQKEKIYFSFLSISTDFEVIFPENISVIDKKKNKI